MLPGSELQDLADDIKARGQLQPIVLDKDGAILDGRNRFAACKLAGVEPQFDTYDGDDSEGYAMTVNLARRHMSKGQKAVVIARACLLNKQPMREAATQYGVSAAYIAKAQVVIEHSDLEDAVRAGIEPLNDAYATASVNKQKSDDEKSAVEQLRKEHPDLADAVDDGEMSLEEALDVRDERREDRKRAGIVAAIEETFCGVEGHGRTFTERVEAEELTWAEAEKLAVDWQKEFRELVERSQRRAMEAAGPGWQTLLRIFQHDDALTKAVLKELTPGAKKYLDEIRADIIELAKEWEGQN
jgi:ParB-like chromosome segregation protein Spo0J